MNTACSSSILQAALAGTLTAEDDSQLRRHLETCEACNAALEQMAGGPGWCQEAASLLAADELDATTPTNERWSEVDFTVEHLEPSDEPNVLGRLGDYDVLEVIGHGGMGVVLKAFDRQLKRCVAIKVLAPHLAHSSLAKQRFAREAQAAAAIVHPHVLAIHQVQPSGRLPFLVMPLVAGESLAERLTAQGTLELKEILRIGMQAAAGLGAAHEQGLVHRDVKPANILLEKGVERAVLTDFGLARAADDVALTRWGIIAGTPQYMSPEQARGEPLDGRSDLFSLGCVLYEMATGVSPFRADSMMATLRRLIDESPRAIGSLNPELPPWFIAIVDRLLEKDPARRFNSARQVSELFERCLAHLQQPASVPLPAELPRSAVRWNWRPSKKIITGVLAMFTASAVGLLSFFLLSAPPPDISGEWSGDDWGQVVLKKISSTEYSGTYSETSGKQPGEIALRWSHVERRFNGDWHEGKERFGQISIRLAGEEIRGAYTTDGKSIINPGTPRLADLAWIKSGPHGAPLADRGGSDAPPKSSPGWGPPEGRLAADSPTAAPLADPGDIIRSADDPASDSYAPPFASPNWKGETAPRWRQVNAGPEVPPQLTIRQQGSVEAIACSPDGKILATNDDGSGVTLYDVQTGQQITSFSILSGEETAQLANLRQSKKAVPQTLEKITATVLAFSHDSQRLAVGNSIGQVKVFDARTGALVMALGGLARKPKDETPLDKPLGIAAHFRVWSIVFAPDDRLLATRGGPADTFSDEKIADEQLSSAENLKIWDVKTGKLLHDLIEEHFGHVSDVAFSPDGKLLASAGPWPSGSGVKLWDAETFKVVKTLQTEVGASLSVAFSPDGERLAISQVAKSGGGGVISIADTATGMFETQWPIEHWASRIGFVRDGKAIAVLDLSPSSPSLRLWDSSTGQPLGEISLEGQFKFVREPGPANIFHGLSAGFVPGTNHVAIGGSDAESNGVVRIWDLAEVGGQTMADVEAPVAEMEPILVAATDIPYNDELTPERVRFEAWAKGKVPPGAISTLEELKGRRSAQKLLAGEPILLGKLMAPTTAEESASAPAPISSARPVLEIHPNAGASLIAYSPDGKTIAIGGGRDAVNVYDAQSGEPANTIKLMETGEEGCLINQLPKERGMGVGSNVDLNVYSLAFSPDSSALAVGNGVGQVKLFDARSGEFKLAIGDPTAMPGIDVPAELRSRILFAHDSVYAIAFSPDGKLLATSGRLRSGPQDLRLWDAKTGKPRPALEGERNIQISRLAFSPDGKLLANAGIWGSGHPGIPGVKLRRPTTGEVIKAISVGDGDDLIRSICFSSDSSKLALSLSTYDKNRDVNVGEIRVLGVPSGNADFTATVPRTYTTVAYSPDGKLLASLSGASRLTLWQTDLAMAKSDVLPPDPEAGEEWKAFAFAPSGSRLAIVGLDTEKHPLLRVWELNAAAAGVKAESPQANEPEAAEAESSLPLRLALRREASGEVGLYLNEQRTDEQQLKRLVTDLKQGSNEPPVLLVADKGLTYGEVVKVIDRLKSVGLRKVSLSTRSVPAAMPAPEAESGVARPQPAGNLTVRVTGPARCEVGANPQFEIAVSNRGSEVLKNIAITDTFDPSLQASQASPEALVSLRSGMGGGTIRWRLGSLAPGITQHLSLPCTCAKPVARVCNRVTVTADGVPVVGGEACVEIDMRKDALPDMFQPTAGQGIAPQPLRTSRQQGTVDVIACSPDGKTLATGDIGSGVKLYDAETAEQIAMFKVLDEKENAIIAEQSPQMAVDGINVTALAFSHDSHLLAVGNRIGQVKLFDARTAAVVVALDDVDRQAKREQPLDEIFDLPRAHGYVWRLAFSPDDSRLATCGSPTEYPQVASAPDEKGPSDGLLKIWDAKTGKLLHDLKGEHNEVLDVAFSPDGKLLASAGTWPSGSGVKLWDAETFKVVKAIRTAQPYCVVFSADGQRLAIGTRGKLLYSGSISVADTSSGIFESSWLMPFAVWQLGFLREGKAIAALSAANTLALWDPATGKPIGDVSAPGRSASEDWKCWDFVSGTNRVAVGGIDAETNGVVRLWNLDAAAVETKAESTEPQKPEETK